MDVRGIDGMDFAEVQREVADGATFRSYEICFSVIIMTFKQPMDPKLVGAGRNRVAPGLVPSLVSFFLGWWGFPWGPIHTIAALGNNFSGGKDVTPAVMQYLQLASRQPPPPFTPPPPSQHQPQPMAQPLQPSDPGARSADQSYDHHDAAAAGWHADPLNRHQYRYWDGEAWTENVVNDGVRTSDPIRT